MTRRQFLKALSAVGGSALVYNAMTAWGMAQPSQTTLPRLPALSGTGNGTRLIILGAGLAGMTTAYELGKLGYECQILEAQDRAGGQAWTVRNGDEIAEFGGERQVVQFDKGTYFNAGPWRIPAHHTSTLHYAKEFNVPLEVFVNENDAAYVYNEGVKGPLSGQRVRLREIKADMNGHTSELLAKAIDQEKLDLSMTQEDQESLVDFLDNFGYLSTSDLRYTGTPGRGFVKRPSAGTQNGVPTDPYEFTALLQAQLGQYFQSVPPFSQPVIAFQPIGGMDLIAKGFEEAVKPQIELQAEVREIRQTPDGVRIVYYDKKTGQTREATGDYCVCTIPLSVLIKIPGDFSGEVRAAMRDAAYAPAGKIGLQMKRRFWEEDDRIFGGHTLTNLPGVGTISYPSYDFQTEKGIVQGYYNFGLEAIEISALSAQERIDFALEQGSKIHPQYRENFETGFSVAWHRVPYALGGWATWSESARKNSYPKLLKPDGSIYFAGHHLSYLEGWQAGAIESAWQQMTKIHKRVRQG